MLQTLTIIHILTQLPCWLFTCFSHTHLVLHDPPHIEEGLLPRTPAHVGLDRLPHVRQVLLDPLQFQPPLVLEHQLQLVRRIILLESLLKLLQAEAALAEHVGGGSRLEPVVKALTGLGLVRFDELVGEVHSALEFIMFAELYLLLCVVFGGFKIEICILVLFLSGLSDILAVPLCPLDSFGAKEVLPLRLAECFGL